MSAQLVALNGTPDVLLTGLLTVVGRHPGCDARLDSSRVSRRHCCLALDGGECLVRDLGSTNGTRINGQLIKDGLLRPGDVLGIAHLRFRLVLSDPSNSKPANAVPRGPEPDPANLVLETALDMAHSNLQPADDENPPPG
jgi:pSer/pThr/pTyr-binding forkhead associated (FHA) protein